MTEHEKITNDLVEAMDHPTDMISEGLYGECLRCGEKVNPVMVCKCPERQIDGSWKPHWKDRIKSILNTWVQPDDRRYTYDCLVSLFEREIKENMNGVLESIQVHFWEDQDHAVGGYISKKDLYDLLLKNKE